MSETNNRPKLFWWIITAFLLVPLIVSIISTIHVINFFELSNSRGLALTLAIAFELGALSALAGLVALDKINKNVVWLIFILLTAYQSMGNVFFAYDYISQKMINNPNLIKNWTELFGLDIEDNIFVKRIIAIISGAVLPIVSLSFLDLSVDYIQKSTGIKKDEKIIEEAKNETIDSEVKEKENNESIVSKNEELTNNENQEPELNIEQVDEDFKNFLANKKKQAEEMKAPNIELLNIFYKNGIIQKGDELLTYSEFINQIDTSRFSQQKINLFLTLCNYLEIFKLSGTHRIALKSHKEAIESLTNYLSVEDNS